LADPTDIKSRDRINNVLKRREWFMPFCPSMTDYAAEEYLINPTEAPFMILTFDVPKNKKKEIPAAIHEDGTCRPQILRKEINPLYYRVMTEFEKHKVPLILNTSFNIHGMPIVMSPQDALNHVVWNCVDDLIIGNYLVRREFKR
jgi:carbamoyltransferase